MAISERLLNYNPPIPNNLRIEYENALAQTMRWEGGLLPSTKDESDLEHVDGMFKILNEVSESSVHIPREINLTTVKDMIYIHDAGETLTGDLAHTHPDFASLKPKIKRREMAAFRLLSRRIEERPIRDLARHLYKRCEEKNPDDKEAQLTDFIDKAQAIRFAVKNVYPARTMKDSNRRAVHLNYSVNLLLKPSGFFYHSLKSPYAKEEAMVLITKELSSFLSGGYKKKEMEPYFNTAHSFSLNGASLHPLPHA